MSEVNPLSRFQPRANISVRPGSCYTCKGNNGPFIDTSVDIAWEGALYICQGCITEMYRQLGLDVPVNEEEIVAREKAAFASGHELGTAQLRTAFDEFVASFEHRAAAITAPDVPSPVEDSDGGKESPRKSKSGRRGTDSGAEQVDSTDSGAGRAELPADSTDGEPSISDILGIG